MKTTFKILGGLFGLGACMLAVLHFFLLYALTDTMHGTVLPQLERETGIDAEVGRLSVNIPEGRLILKKVKIKNPDGFALENMAVINRIDIGVDYWQMLTQKLILVKHVEIRDALVHVIRNEAGDVNIAVLREKSPQPEMPRSEPTASEPEKTPAPEKSPQPESRGTPPPEPSIPEILVESLRCKARVHYTDMKQGDLDVALDMELKAENLSTLADPETKWGRAHLSGGQSGRPECFKIDLFLELAPVQDFRRLTFDLTGQVLEIDPRFMGRLHSRYGLRSEPFGCDPRIYCRNGWFQQSKIGLRFRNVELKHSLVKKLGRSGTVEELKLVVPLQGNLRQPAIDVEAALKRNLSSGNLESILEIFAKDKAAE